MKRLHMVNGHMIQTLMDKRDNIAVAEFMNNPEYKDFLIKCSEKYDVFVLSRGEAMIDFGEDVGAKKCWIVDDGILVSRKVRKKVEKARKKFNEVIVTLPKAMEYYSVVKEYGTFINDGLSVAFPLFNHDNNSRICFEKNGWGRFSFIWNMAKDGFLDSSKNNYLYELENPAELSAYHNLLTGKVFNSFKAFTSIRCFVDSMYGVIYTSERGLLCNKIEQGSLYNIYKNHQQFSIFFLNDETMLSYIRGTNGDAIVSEFKNKMEGKNGNKRCDRFASCLEV